MQQRYIFLDYFIILIGITDDFKSEEYKKNGHPSKAGFVEFARRIHVTESRVGKLLPPFLEKQKLVEKPAVLI